MKRINFRVDHVYGDMLWYGDILPSEAVNWEPQRNDVAYELEIPIRRLIVNL